MRIRLFHGSYRLLIAQLKLTVAFSRANYSQQFCCFAYRKRTARALIFIRLPSASVEIGNLPLQIWRTFIFIQGQP